jgi:hypothetical protein
MPVLRVPLTRDHLSVISGMTDQGRRFQILQTAAYRSADVVRFLRHLLRQVAGKLVVIWDGAPIHRSHAIKDFLASGAAGRMHLVRLRATRRTSIRMRVSGNTSSTWSCAIAVAVVWRTCARNCAWPSVRYVTSPGSSVPVFATAIPRFNCFRRRGQ